MKVSLIVNFHLVVYLCKIEKIYGVTTCATCHAGPVPSKEEARKACEKSEKIEKCPEHSEVCVTALVEATHPKGATAGHGFTIVKACETSHVCARQVDPGVVVHECKPCEADLCNKKHSGAGVLKLPPFLGIVLLLLLLYV